MMPAAAKALLSSFRSVKVTAMSDSAAGASAAAKPPCTARAVISTAIFGAPPPSAEAAANPASPVRNMRLRPNTSDSRPANGSRLPNDRV